MKGFLAFFILIQNNSKRPKLIPSSAAGVGRLGRGVVRRFAGFLLRRGLGARRRYTSDFGITPQPRINDSNGKPTWLLARQPLDVAATGRLRHFRSRFATQHRVQRLLQGITRSHLITFWAGIIKLPSIVEPTLSIEQEKIWSACRSIRLRYRLIRIDQIRKIPTILFRKARHKFRPVLRKSCQIIRDDCYRIYPTRCGAFGPSTKTRSNMNHIRTVIAGKADELTACPKQLGKLMERTACIRQRKLWSQRSRL